MRSFSLGRQSVPLQAFRCKARASGVSLTIAEWVMIGQRMPVGAEAAESRYRQPCAAEAPERSLKSQSTWISLRFRKANLQQLVGTCPGPGAHLAAPPGHPRGEAARQDV